MTEEWLGMEDICFVTGKIIRRWEQARFTWEFDAWISKEGQAIIEREGTSDYPHSEEAVIIYSEWYAQDAAAAARDEDYMDADANNEEFRQWHK